MVAWINAYAQLNGLGEKPKMTKNPVKKNMDKFHKPKKHRDKTKYRRKDNGKSTRTH